MHYKILIVEDEKPLLHALEDKLILEGFEVILAGNGQEGLNLALSKKPDLILLDIVMPIMDGMEMLGRLRSDSWGAEVPVILLTNLSEGEKVKAALKSGVHDYLVKSDWKLEDVVAKIRGKLS